ncbi:MAG: ABC transporter ATP-binding protein [Rhodobiaceae bacterium]|nr:ABC transporter ATP-binding protein [Rhodobiaceae bacterium]
MKSPDRSKSTVSARQIISFIWFYWRRQGFWFALLMLGMAANVAVDILFPIVSGYLVDIISTASFPPEPAEIDAAFWAAVLFVGQGVAFLTIQRLKFRLWMFFTARVMRDIVTEAFARVQRFPSNWHESAHAGATVRKLTRGMWAYDTIADTVYAVLIPTAFMLIGVLSVLTWRWPLVGLYAAVTSVLYVAVTIWLAVRHLPERHRAHMKADSEVGALVADAITCNSVVKSYGTEKREDDRLLSLAEVWRGKAVRAWIAMENIMIVQNVAAVFLQAGILALVIVEWAAGRASTGDIVFAITTYLLINAYLRDMGYHLQNLQQGVSEIEDLILFHDLPLEPAAAGNADPLVMKGGAVHFDKVRFNYPRKDQAVYSNLSVDIRAGEKIALVGKSGSGKSTFVKLLQRLYDLDAGRVLIDGQDIATVDPTSLRRAVSVVPQEPLLFHRTLGENIGYAKPGATEQEIWRAARLARADKFIEGLPEGLETLVGERGVKLSGGERQRVAIARAFLADAPILVLDEATSSLDVVTEAAVQDAMRELMKGRTTIIIAHRLSTVRQVDRVLVFEDGVIVEEGPYDELIARKGGYLAEFHMVQSAGDLSPTAQEGRE